jgi:hypothetical protein
MVFFFPALVSSELQIGFYGDPPYFLKIHWKIIAIKEIL